MFTRDCQVVFFSDGFYEFGLSSQKKERLSMISCIILTAVSPWYRLYFGSGRSAGLTVIP